jgi:hypothetical protein
VESPCEFVDEPSGSIKCWDLQLGAFRVELNTIELGSLVGWLVSQSVERSGGCRSNLLRLLLTMMMMVIMNRILSESFSPDCSRKRKHLIVKQYSINSCIPFAVCDYYIQGPFAIQRKKPLSKLMEGIHFSQCQ